MTLSYSFLTALLLATSVLGVLVGFVIGIDMAETRDDE